MSTPAAPIVVEAPKLSSVHSPEDAVFNRIVAATTKAAVQTVPPTEPTRVDPVSAQPVPAVVSAQITAAPGGVEPEKVAVIIEPEIGFNPEEIDFDAPPALVAPTPTPVSTPEGGEKRTPTEIEAQLDLDLTSANDTPEVKARWEKIAALALQHPRGQRMMNALRVEQALTAPPTVDGKGGIGRMPTVDEIKMGDEALREITLLRNDLDVSPAGFVENLFGINPAVGASWLGPPEKAITILSEIPKFLFEANQNTQHPAYAKMYESIANPIFQRFLDHQYSLATHIADGDQRDKFLYALRVVENQAFGKYRPLPSDEGFSSTPNPEVEAMKARLKVAEDTIQNGHRSSSNQVQTSIINASFQEIGRVADTAIAFSRVDKIIPASLLGPLKAQLGDIINAELPRSNATGWAMFQSQMDRAKRGLMDSSIPVGTLKSLAQNVVKSSPAVRAKMQELVDAAKRMHGQTTATMERTQAMTVPSGGASPATSSVLPTPANITRMPGEDQQDFLARRLSGRMQAKV